VRRDVEGAARNQDPQFRRPNAGKGQPEHAGGVRREVGFGGNEEICGEERRGD